MTKGDAGRGRTSSLDIINDKGLIAKIENYFVQDMQQEFLKPSKEDNPRYIYRIDNKIQLQAKVRSGKVLGTFERTTKGGGTTVIIREGMDSYDTEFVPLPSSVEYINILEGRFRITALVDGVQRELIKFISSNIDSTNYLREDSLGWYNASVNIDYPDLWKNATSITGVRVFFNARDQYGWGNEISLNVDKIVERDPPKLIALTMTNNTLNSFMGQLRKSDNTETFDSNSIRNATIRTKSNSLGLTVSDLNSSATNTGMSLNVKDGDKIKLEFFIEDESINSLSKEIKLIYNSTTYSANFVRTVLDTSGRPTRVSEWKIDNLTYKNAITNGSFSIRDDSPLPNQLDISANIFVQPEILANTNLLLPNNTNRYTDDYYDTNLISASNIVGALGYLLVFDYDNTQVDNGVTIGVYPSIGTKEWFSYASKDFSFYEGRHAYNGLVYVINPAGAIQSVTHGDNKNALLNNENVSTIINSINVAGKNLYIDKVKPNVSNFKLVKEQDSSLSEFLNNNSLARSILLGDINDSRHYKENDVLSMNLNLTEVNFYKSLFDTDILNIFSTSMGGNEISINPTTGLEGVISSYINASYKKTGYAKDLTSGNDAGIQKTVTLLLYDRAGNETRTTFTAYYDDSIPNNVTVASERTGEGDNKVNFKYTSNRNLPLTTRIGSNYSLAKLTSKETSYIGDLRPVGTINLTSFSNNSGNLYTPVENAHNLFKLMTFSKSGKAGIDSDDSIILDRAINDSRMAITEKNYTYDEINKNYIINLTNTLSTITELVGLEKYRISTTSNGIRLNDGTSTKVVNSTGTEVILNSKYYNNPTATVYNSINNLILPSSGKIKFKILLTDRLGNTKIIDYTIEVPDNIQLIGKTLDSQKEIKTTIKSSVEGIKIESRKE